MRDSADLHRALLSVVSRIALLVALSVIYPAISFAQRVEVYDVGINMLGSHEGFVFYATLDKLPPQGCAWGAVYCPTSDPECKSRMAVALMAKALNKRLLGVWIDLDYAQGANGAPMCKLSNLAFQ
jgi:hypothetical protein